MPGLERVGKLRDVGTGGRLGSVGEWTKRLLAVRADQGVLPNPNIKICYPEERLGGSVTCLDTRPLTRPLRIN